MKISANFLALYSVLKPDTSSLSPSAKSKGVRLVSASKITIHMNNTLGKMHKVKVFELGESCLGEMKFKIIIKNNTTKIRLIS
jgi:hypothetical protein